MKISTFAKLNNITIDSVRHYIELGLVLPMKKGGHYDFDDRCQQDIKEVLNLKNMGFTLNEISLILKYKRLGTLTPYKEDGYYKSLFINRLNRLTNDIEVLEGYKQNLEKRLEEIRTKEKLKTHQIGVNVKYLDILACPKCSRELMLVEGSINHNQVIDGKLRCNCGEEYTIKSGIINNINDTIEDFLTNKDEYSMYLTEYIYSTDTSYLDSVNRGLEWGYKRLDFNHFDGKILLELGTGFGFFLRYIYNDLPDNCLYIAIDYNMDRQRFLKDLLENSGCKKNVLFICSDFLEIPLKSKVVDILLDLSGTSNYSFTNEGSLLTLTDKYIKEESYLYGSYILFKNFGTNSLIGESYRKNFMLENIKASILELKYKLINEGISDYIEAGGKYENYFVKGEKIFIYNYYGER